ncbi:MAG TPA: FAD-dependent monooxygenase [Mycobacteriales bacterium]|nr:FAD-dependent monooxygenase [Mycobacteriales bacterium]
MTTAEVLVVGAGPTGLTAATELARRGIEVRIVDAASTPNTETRALGVQARTLELLARQGTAEPIIADGLAVTDFHVLSENHEIMHLLLSGLDSPYPYLLMLPQPQVEAHIATRLGAAGITIERPVRLRDLHQDAAGVQVRLQHGDGTIEELQASWVIGCDGARSAVRERLGMAFEGDAFEESFAVADVRMDWQLPYDELFAFLNRGDFMTFFPMPHGLHRVAIAYADRAGEPDGPVTVEELQRSAQVCGPPGARVAEVLQAGRFHINQRYVERHSRGRVFLAGDAAHVHSVVGAQGMNTGIQDAFNLGWKLAAVIRGRAHPALLDTYAQERGAVARRLVKGTRRFTQLTLLHDPVTTALRRDIAPHILSRPRVQHALTEAVAQIDVSYHDGSHHNRVPQAGDRAPDVPVLHNGATVQLFRLLDPVDYTLLAFGPVPRPHPLIGRVLQVTDAPTVDGDRIRVGGAAIRGRYGVPGAGVVLIRPDGYVGFRAVGDESAGLEDYLAGPAADRRTVRSGGTVGR